MGFLDQRRLDPLLLGSPLRRPAVAVATALALAILLAVAAFTLLGFLGSLRPDVARIFFAAMALSTLLALVPLSILWYLDRRERELPWLFAVAFLWGAFMSTGLALPFNNVLPLFFALQGAAAGESPPANGAPPDVSFWEAWFSGSLADLTIFLPFVIIMALLLWRSGVWERRVIREELAGEVGRAVSPIEYEQILRDSMFRTRRIDRIHPSLSRALVNAQHELAFRKRRARDEGRDPDDDPLVRSWREEISLLRQLA